MLLLLLLGSLAAAAAQEQEGGYWADAFVPPEGKTADLPVGLFDDPIAKAQDLSPVRYAARSSVEPVAGNPNGRALSDRQAVPGGDTPASRPRRFFGQAPVPVTRWTSDAQTAAPRFFSPSPAPAFPSGRPPAAPQHRWQRAPFRPRPAPLTRGPDGFRRTTRRASVWWTAARRGTWTRTWRRSWNRPTAGPAGTERRSPPRLPYSNNQ